MSRLFWPHVGGVEKHVDRLSSNLRKKGNEIFVLTEKFKTHLKASEEKDGVRIVRFSYPKIKILGLLIIWKEIYRRRDLIRSSDLVHIHDVFIWYLPFRFLFPKKAVYTTFHGWEGVYPIPLKNILLKKIAVKLSQGNICVGKYIEKYFGIQANRITYGAVDTKPKKNNIKEKLCVYLGRLEKDTGLPVFLKKLQKLDDYKVVFCGDGALRRECEKYGRVLGFVDPEPYLAKASICLPSGYLSALEAMNYKCEIKLVWDNPLKKAYWTMTPFYKWVKNKDKTSAFNWVKGETWEKLADCYLKLWNQ